MERCENLKELKMKTKTKLLLGSQSVSRQMLLNEARIPFELIGQYADEAQCDWGLPLKQAVVSIAQHKMNHVIMPEGCDGDIRFVLTADTLSVDAQGILNGKPKDLEDAINKIRLNRGIVHELATAFCLERKVFTDGQWRTQARIDRVVGASYIFDIPDEWLSIYLKKTIALKASGAVAVEQFGSQFLKSITGSYTTIIGLPLFELREALTELGFYQS